MPGSYPAKDRLNVAGVVDDLVAGEEKRDQAGRVMRLLAERAPRLLVRVPVVRETIGLDDDPQRRVPEVDAVAVERALRQRVRQADPA
jgi:hypothetical protein